MHLNINHHWNQNNCKSPKASFSALCSLKLKSQTIYRSSSSQNGFCLHTDCTLPSVIKFKNRNILMMMILVVFKTHINHYDCHHVSTGANFATRVALLCRSHNNYGFRYVFLQVPSCWLKEKSIVKISQPSLEEFLNSGKPSVTHHCNTKRVVVDRAGQ